jgi:hypothetical protein
MAGHLISKGLLSFPTELLEMKEVQGSRHFQISKAISTNMRAGPAGWTSRMPHWGSGEPHAGRLPSSFTDQASPAARTHDKTYDEPFAMLYNVQRLSILTIAQPSSGITCACQTNARSRYDKSIRRAATCMPSSPIGARGYD